MNIKPTEHLDHTKLEPGLYETQIYETKTGEKISTYEAHVIAPKENVQLSIDAMHTIEHVVAKKLREWNLEKVLFVGPMGCGTGIYVICEFTIDRKAAAQALINAIAGVLVIKSHTDIYQSDPANCGATTRFQYDPFMKSYIAKFIDRVCEDRELTKPYYIDEDGEYQVSYPKVDTETIL